MFFNSLAFILVTDKKRNIGCQLHFQPMLRFCYIILLLSLFCNKFHIMSYHDLYQFLESCLCRIPSKLRLRLRRISPQIDNIGRTIKLLGYLNDYHAGCLVDTDLVHALSLEFQLDARLAERILAELSDGMLYAGCNHEILRLVML